MKNFTPTEIRFSGSSIKSCVVFIDLVNSTTNTLAMDNLEHIRMYYSNFINSVSKIIKKYDGKVIKYIGDCILVYFPKTSDNKNEQAFREVIECGLKILDSRYNINQELSKQNIPPFSYKISMDYGLLDLALVGEKSQIDWFGSTINLCSKINSSSLSTPNDIIIGDNFCRILKSFSNIMNSYNFINNGEYKITQTIGYSTFNIKKLENLHINDNSNKYSLNLDSPIDYCIETKSKNHIHFTYSNNNKKRLIFVDDDSDILLTYESFLNEKDYEITSFTDPVDALNFIKNLSHFNDLLITLDVKMKNLNGFQLHQQIKAIDTTIKILFVTILDISEEILTIIPGISKEQILIKPVNKDLFTNTVEKMLK